MPAVLLSGFDDTTAHALVELLPQVGFSCAEKAADVQLIAHADSVHPAVPAIPAVYAGAKDSGPAPYLRMPFRAEALALQLTQAIKGASLSRSIPLDAEWSISLAERTLQNAGRSKTVPMTEKECALLEMLYTRVGQPVSRQELLEKIWGYGEHIATHTLESHMHRLRTKLREAAGSDHWITTSETGYALKV